jgi:hypothetical protein
LLVVLLVVCWWFSWRCSFLRLLCPEGQHNQRFASSVVCFKGGREISGGQPPEAMKSIDLTLFLR